VAKMPEKKISWAEYKAMGGLWNCKALGGL
jgi:hypothetical protein